MKRASVTLLIVALIAGLSCFACESGFHERGQTTVQLLSHTMECDSFWGDWDCTVGGMVKNTGDLDTEIVTIHAKFYNASNVLIDTSMDSIFDLGAGETATFEVWYLGDGKPHHYDIWVEYFD